ncbi:hypothetical protein [Trichocoleus sp. FACHB-262]|uniref:hypothetical protein n=1 Tax=Trichocoleus sp. FACHB-262 TaxID=2692869 RepID=UPI001688072A|nr:hypothetical protein [Trichocoleus sp. FACHB-262]MBD2124742.1 hypothetical protein [Trichocoleus sp. FACHB-262]
MSNFDKPEASKTNRLKQAFCQVMAAEAIRIPQTPTQALIEEVTPLIPHIIAATEIDSMLDKESLIVPHTRIAWFYQGQEIYPQALL